MMVDHVIGRLKTRIAQLQGRVSGAADLMRLQASNQLPQVTPAAHVVPMGRQSRGGESSAGMFTQMVEQVVGVILTFRHAGATGSGVLDQLDSFIDEITAAVAGSGPEDAADVFRFVRGQVVRMEAGTLVYELDFAITDQLRITP